MLAASLAKNGVGGGVQAAGAAVSAFDDSVQSSVAESALAGEAALVIAKPVRMKRARASPPSHPDCTKCSVKRSKVPGQGSAWSQFLKKYMAANPSMSVNEATIEARKRYVPPSGHKKSYERIFKEIWRLQHPSYKTEFTPEQAKEKMREDYLAKI